LDNSFITENGINDVKSGEVEVHVLLNKTESFLELDVSLKGELEIMCDRCLEYFNYPVKFNGSLVVKFSEASTESSDEIIVIHPNDHELDLKQYIYESLCLSIPYRKVHPEDKEGNSACNQDMIDRFGNIKIEEDKKDDKTDPRWDLLKDIIENNN
jgi:uncharacterized metal-binding protein YceD (DUF177 family)